MKSPKAVAIAVAIVLILGSIYLNTTSTPAVTHTTPVVKKLDTGTIVQLEVVFIQQTTPKHCVCGPLEMHCIRPLTDSAVRAYRDGFSKRYHSVFEVYVDAWIDTTGDGVADINQKRFIYARQYNHMKILLPSGNPFHPRKTVLATAD